LDFRHRKPQSPHNTISNWLAAAPGRAGTRLAASVPKHFTAHVGARQQAAAQLLGGHAINSLSWKSVVDKKSLVEKESPLIMNFRSAQFSALRTGLVIMKGLRLRPPG
ncbi:MAG: hypothetical protein ACOYB2_19875, partial [Limnohabitans sp.]